MRVPTVGDIIKILIDLIFASEQFTITTYVLVQGQCCRGCVGWRNAGRCVWYWGAVMRTLSRNRLENERNTTLLISSGRDKSYEGK